MDSGNSSSSLQSSNNGGGCDEFSSLLSAFSNKNLPPQTPTTPFSIISTKNHMFEFDPLSNYLDPTQPSSSVLNLEMMWSKNHRSEPNPTHLPCSTSFSPSPHNLDVVHNNNTNLLIMPQGSGSRNNDQGHNIMVRNPKKRSRASKRAPTTVLTTNTTNFRAMVQEFTGIPTPPFTSHFPRTRLDLFAPLHSSASLTRPSTFLDPSFLQQHRFPTSNNNSTDSTSINYPFNFNNNNLNILTFQRQQQQPSLEIPQPSYGSLKVGVLEEIGLRHADVNNNNNNNISGLHQQKNIQNMVPSGNNNLSANASSMDQWAHETDTVEHFSSASSLSYFHGQKLPRSTTTVAAAAAEPKMNKANHLIQKMISLR